jgi:hypothetical protein
MLKNVEFMGITSDRPYNSSLCEIHFRACNVRILELGVIQANISLYMARVFRILRHLRRGGQIRSGG